MRLDTDVLMRNPVVRIAVRVMLLMQNKLFFSLFMIYQGIMFLVAPSGKLDGMVQMTAVLLIAAAAVNIFIHLFLNQRRAKDYVLSIVNLALIGFSVFMLIKPSILEPVFRYAIGAITAVTNVMNIIELIKLHRHSKKDWKFYLEMFVSVVMTVLGVAMFFASEQFIVTVQRGVGAFLILNFALNVWHVVRIFFVKGNK